MELLLSSGEQPGFRMFSHHNVSLISSWLWIPEAQTATLMNRCWSLGQRIAR